MRSFSILDPELGWSELPVASQRTLTCVDVPCVSTPFLNLRLSMEIALGKESGGYQGRGISHFELYLEVMEEAKTDTCPIRKLVSGASREKGRPTPKFIAERKAGFPVCPDRWDLWHRSRNTAWCCP